MAQWRRSRRALRHGRPLKVRGSHLFTRPDALSRDRTVTIEGDSPSMTMLLIIMGMQWRVRMYFPDLCAPQTRANGRGSAPAGSPPPAARVQRITVVRVGLLGRPRAGACPNLLQRRPGPESAVGRSAEYQRFSSGAPARSGPLQQIWTTGAAAGSGRGGHGPDGDHGGRPDARAVRGDAARARRARPGPTRTGATPRRATGPAPPARRGSPVDAPRRARSSLNPRARHLTREIAG